MGRQCAVRGCNNTDMSILCHRFPKRMEVFKQWQQSLQLMDAEANLLMQRFVVCTLHFKTSDYRNPTSRKLNTVAIPTLSINSKSPFYNAPTSTFGSGGNNNVRVYSNDSRKPVQLITKVKSPKKDDHKGTSITSSLIIERVESPKAAEELVSEVDMVYFIEEEIVTETIKDYQDDESSSTESPTAKKYKLEDSDIDKSTIEQNDPPEEEIGIDLQPALECRNSSVQTDDIEIVSQEDQQHYRLIKECYPEYASYSRLDFAKQLKERDEQLIELTKKLANFETAHATMIKTMEAFKTLVNS